MLAPNGYSQPQAQLTMLLSALAYADEKPILGESVAQQEQRMRLDINMLLANEPMPAQQWQVVWGPALDVSRASMMYVAGNTTANQYTVVVRGTDWSFLLNWFEDFGALVGLVPCPGLSDPTVQIAMGTSIGLAALLKLQDIGGTQLLPFLQTLPADASICVTGHSVGGCLASALAPVIANHIDAHRIQVYTFAAPSAGGTGFAQYFNTLFVPQNAPSRAFRVFNDLDVVPHAWADLHTIETYYQGFVPCPADIKSILEFAINHMPGTYVQVGTPIELHGSIVQPGQGNTDPISDALFLWQTAQQHCKWTYYHLLGATRPRIALTKAKRIAATFRSQSNPSSQQPEQGELFYVTYHGGAPGAANNIYAYDHNGNQLSASVLPVQSQADLSELRGIYFNHGYLYVVNGGKHVSDVLCCSGSGTSYIPLPAPFVSGTTVNSIMHPFALAFNGSTCFVSNQDTNVVTMLTMSSPTQATASSGAAATYLTKLDPSGTFLDGTFVASCNGELPHVPLTPSVQTDQGGLNVTIFNGKVQHSVRDIVLAAPVSTPQTVLLYVADEPGNLIRLYDPGSGTPCGVSTPVNAPTHLLAYNGMLYVSAGDAIYSGALVATPGTTATEPCLNLQAISYTLPPGVDATKLTFAGMTVDSSGSFYIAVRTEDLVLKFDKGDFSKSSIWLHCPKHSSPEFIVCV